MQRFGNTGIYPAIFQIQNEEIIINFLATFFCFFALVAYLFKDKEKKPRKFSVCVACGSFVMKSMLVERSTMVRIE